MTHLPNSDRAVLDLRKLRDYCLDLSHPRGRHKARVFQKVVGIGRGDAAWLRDVILLGVRQMEAIKLGTDRFGTRWRVDVPLTGQGKNGVIRTIWIVKNSEALPRFVTCWVM
jgi:hypothetical protein